MENNDWLNSLIFYRVGSFVVIFFIRYERIAVSACNMHLAIGLIKPKITKIRPFAKINSRDMCQNISLRKYMRVKTISKNYITAKINWFKVWLLIHVWWPWKYVHTKWSKFYHPRKWICVKYVKFAM